MERELADELQFHLDRQAEERAGEPRARAGVEQIKEACRDARGIGVLDRARQDLLYTWRLCVRQPAFTIAVIGTLALGIGGASTMFAIVDGVLLKPLPYPEADRILRIGRSFGGVRVSATSAVDHANLASRASTLSAVAVARTETADVAVDASPARVEIASVSASYFDVLGIPASAGQVLSPVDDGPGGRSVAVISDAFWRRLGRHANPVGGSISINGQPHTIIGVMPRGFRGPEALNQQGVDVWLPLGRIKLSSDPDDASLGTIALVAPATNQTAVTNELAVIGGSAARFWTAPLHAETVGASASGLWLLFGSVSLLLLLACSNVAHLFLIRAADRTREIAVRAAMGAGGTRIARQLLTETVCFSVAGGVAGAMLAFGGVELVRFWAPADLPRINDLRVDVRVLLFAFVVAAAAGVLFGIAPALQASRSDFARILRGASPATTSTRTSERTRGALVIIQTALAAALVLGASLLANSVWRLSRVDPGFDPSHVVWLDLTLPERAYTGPLPKTAFFDDLLRRGRAVAGIESFSLIQGAPLGGGNSVATIAPEGRVPADGDQPARVPYHVVAPGYFDTMRIGRLDGRDFATSDRADSPRVAVVSRAFADRYWPGDRAIGRRFWLGRVAADAPLTEVIGVVEDVRQYSLAEAPIPVVYRAQAQVPRGTVTIVARHEGQSAVTAIDRIRATVRTLDLALALDRAGTMEAQVSASIREPRFRALALSAFSVIACVIACVGLYGSLASLVRARGRELGVRLALGAPTGALKAMVVRRGLLLAAAGIALGIAGGAAASTLIASLVFGISPIDPPTYALTAIVMLALAFAASWLPARRAARISPLEMFRD